MFDDAEVELTAPLPTAHQQQRLHPISGDGIREMRVERL
jgi:hypothetical protein